jgi:hypothetical protein
VPAPAGKRNRDADQQASSASIVRSSGVFRAIRTAPASGGRGGQWLPPVKPTGIMPAAIAAANAGQAVLDNDAALGRHRHLCGRVEEQARCGLPMLDHCRAEDVRVKAVVKPGSILI